MASAGSSALGLGAVGFGTLLIYAAYTKKPVFGADGIIRQFLLNTDPASQFGRIAGKTVSSMPGFGNQAEETRRPLNQKPPGA